MARPSSRRRFSGHTVFEAVVNKGHFTKPVDEALTDFKKTEPLNDVLGKEELTPLRKEHKRDLALLKRLQGYSNQRVIVWLRQGVNSCVADYKIQLRIPPRKMVNLMLKLEERASPNRSRRKLCSNLLKSIRDDQEFLRRVRAIAENVKAAGLPVDEEVFTVLNSIKIRYGQQILYLQSQLGRHH